MAIGIGRRQFIGALGGAAAWPLAARAQQPAMPVVGYLGFSSSSEIGPRLAAFLAGLNENGYVDGQSLKIEYRWAEGQAQRIPAFAAELVHLHVAAIVAPGVARDAIEATKAIPIIFTTGGDPIALGFVASLAHPSGNVTGATFYSTLLMAKQLDLLSQLVPKATVVGTIVNPIGSDYQGLGKAVRDAQDTAHKLGMQIVTVEARGTDEFDEAFASLAQKHVDALVGYSDPLFNQHIEELVALATRYAVPAIYGLREFPAAGGLMSYGADINDTYRQAGVYTGRILKGDKPADLPVVQPTKFELVINMKTAKALGITVPPSMQLLADEIIE